MSKKLVAAILCALMASLMAGALVYAGDPTLVGWWKLDDGTGTVAKDSSGHGNNGTLNGNPQWVPGHFGGALKLDGSDDYIDAGKDPSLDLTAWTITFWLNAAQNKNYNAFVVKGLDAAENYEVLGFGDGSIHMPIAFNDGTRTYFNTPTGIIVVGEWTHFAYTYESGKGRRLYKNGNPVYSDTQSGTPRASTDRLALGTEQPTSLGRFTNGTMDDMRIYNRVLTPEELSDVVRGKGPDKELAGKPRPADQATDVPRDTVLAWEAGEFAVSHDVYFGTAFADVNTASRAAAQGVLASQGQAGLAFDPPGSLAYGQTYYWRIDEVNKAPDNTLFKGAVWSFTAEPYGYPVKPVKATASSNQVGMGPENTINGSGLDKSDLHGTEPTTMWMSAGAQPNWIQYEFDKVCKLHQLLVWNSNQLIESFLGFGARKVTVETSTDGTTWTPLANVPEFGRAPGAPGYAANTTVNFGGVEAKVVKLTINNTWGGIGSATGIAEVRFSYVPVQARAPQPALAATGVSIDTDLNWRPGREAGSHSVSFGTDPAALGAAKKVTDHSFDPGSLNFGTKYYWKVDEVNTVTYPGDLWSFTTQEFAAIDDFESYTDKPGAEVFTAWVDGVTDGRSNSVVGLATAVNGTFCDTTVFHGGKASMPFEYNNIKTPFYSEATRTFDQTQDWTGNGANTLSLWIRGWPAAFVDKGNGAFTIGASGHDIWDAADDFRFVCKQLNGDGSIVVKVDSLVNTNGWAKAGVMIRQNLTDGSPMVDNVISASNGVGLQYRLTGGAGASNTNAPNTTGIAAPQWVKLTRKGNDFTAQYSADGKTWLDVKNPALTGTPVSITVSMTGTVYIGLCVSSHDAALTTTAEFSGVATTGNVSGVWQQAWIGNDPDRTNGPASLYIVVEDKAGKKKTVIHPDPAAAAIGAWTQWRIPFSDLAGVNLAAAKKLTIGVGDPASPKAGGAGKLFLDDIGFGKPAQ